MHSAAIETPDRKRSKPNPKEPTMNREFQPTPNALRAAFATAALLVSLLVVSAMAGLGDHYYAEVLASASSTVVAQR